MPANGPSVPGGRARVSRRACRISLSSWSSTRSESYILRTFQSMPAPINEAISFGVSSTESGTVVVRRFPTFAFPDAVADAVGAPPAVSATEGSAVERPNQRAAVCMIGSRNHQTSASAPMMTIAQPSLSAPLRQPFMVSDLIHRAILLECALHQVHFGHGDGRVEVGARKNLVESLEVSRPCIARRARQRDMRAKRTRFGRKPERSEGLLDFVLEQLETRLRRYACPQDVRTVIVGEHAKAGDLQRQGSRLTATSSNVFQRRAQLWLSRLLDLLDLPQMRRRDRESVLDTARETRRRGRIPCRQPELARRGADLRLRESHFGEW